ncbi:EscU/YscU/HrcU family type III secretion system export apparatus switch protein [Vibrio lentus]|nr:EscU/YscU/HrcU family type III secretion system export apparatus switch protein [Vibrio lentus]
MAEKTEKPTPKKIKDARKKGQVAQTPDIPKLIACYTILKYWLRHLSSSWKR